MLYISLAIPELERPMPYGSSWTNCSTAGAVLDRFVQRMSSFFASPIATTIQASLRHRAKSLGKGVAINFLRTCWQENYKRSWQV